MNKKKSKRSSQSSESKQFAFRANRLLLPSKHLDRPTIMQESSSFASVLTGILQQPLKRDELEFEVTDPHFVDEFERAWARFLQENPDVVPRGNREDRLRSLQRQAAEVEQGQLEVLTEMEQQIEFFRASCEAMEDVYAGKMQAAIEKQRGITEDLQKLVDNVSIADHLQQQTLPWHHFIHEVEQAAKEGGESWEQDDDSLESSRSIARPSSHARILTDRTQGSASDILLRSYKIDHALLTTHIRVLSKEVERYERMVHPQEMTGKFLRDYNAWKILMKSTSGSSDSSSSGMASSSESQGF